MNSSSNIESMGIFGKLISWLLKTVFGDNYQLNAVSIFGTLLSVVFLVVGIVLLIKSGVEFLSSKKDESKKTALSGLAFFAIGAVGLIIVMAYYNNVVSNFG